MDMKQGSKFENLLSPLRDHSARDYGVNFSTTEQTDLGEEDN